MKLYSCPECSFEFNESAIEEGLTKSLVQCPRCSALLEDFSVQKGNDASTSFYRFILQLQPYLPKGVLDNPDWGVQKPDLNENEISELEQKAENSSLTDDYDYWSYPPDPLVLKEVASYPPELVIDDKNHDPAEQFVRKIKLQFVKLMWLLFSYNGRIGRATAFLSTILLWGIGVLSSFLITSIYNTNPLLIFHHYSIFNSTSEDTLPGTLTFIGLIAYYWSSWVIGLKRFHDFNAFWGALLLLEIVPIFTSFLGISIYLGTFILLYFMFLKKGTQGPNQYGAGPGWINRPPEN